MSDQHLAAVEFLNPSTYQAHVDPGRPYNGQPWTAEGVRGAQAIIDLSVRDVYDAVIRAVFESHGLLPEERPESIYDLPGDVDPMALAQNVVVELEKAMGIYPNLPAES